MSPGGGAGYRDDCRNCTPSSRYAADVRQGLSLVHVVACKSWDLPLKCPPCQGHGVGQWPGNITHGRPSGGWNYIDPLNWITRRKNSRNTLPRFSGSNRSGRARNTFCRIKNSTLNGEDFPSSPINKHLYHLHGPSRTRFQRSTGAARTAERGPAKVEAAVTIASRRTDTSPTVPTALTCANLCGCPTQLGICDPVGVL